jgi:hypothetical protein
MAIRNLCCLLGRILVVLALVLFVPTAMVLFMLYDSVRWLISRLARPATELRRRLVHGPAWRTGPSFG